MSIVDIGCEFLSGKLTLDETVDKCCETIQEEFIKYAKDEYSMSVEFVESDDPDTFEKIFGGIIMKQYDDGYFISKEYKPCCVCGKPTNRVEYNYETYICSRDCEDILNKKLFKAENCNEWHNSDEEPDHDRWCIVEDENGKQYDCHMYNGTCWYSYIIYEDNSCDGWRSDVNVKRWKYDDERIFNENFNYKRRTKSNGESSKLNRQL